MFLASTSRRRGRRRPAALVDVAPDVQKVRARGRLPLEDDTPVRL
jgi:hypothetical protein